MGDNMAAMIQCLSGSARVRQNWLSKHARNVLSGDELSRRPQEMFLGRLRTVPQRV